MKNIVLVSIASFLLIASGSLYACGGKRGHGMFNVDMMGHMLDLTEEQKQSLTEYRKQAKSERKAAFKARSKIKMKDLDPSAADYQAKVEILANENAERARAKTLHRAQFHAKLYEVLTPEQRGKFEEVMADMRKKHKKRGQKNRHDV